METRKEKTSGGAATTLSIELRSVSEVHEMRGTVLHGDKPRLLALDGIDVEAPLGRNLLYMRNQDIPGVIGKVGTILGDGQINIADFSLGRGDAASRGSAIGIVHIDGPVPEPVLEKIRKVSAVVEARAVVL
jgi:D-3-phosphoglycerate dehydrogenase